MADQEVYRVTVGPKGRLVIPAALRRELGINEGDTVAVRLTEEGDALEVITSAAAMRRVQRMVAEKVPPEVDLVAELLEDRRREFERELREEQEIKRRLAESQRRTGT